MKRIKTGAKFPQNEVSILQKIDHPNVVKVVDAFKCDAEFFVVFERAESGLTRRHGAVHGQARRQDDPRGQREVLSQPAHAGASGGPGDPRDERNAPGHQAQKPAVLFGRTGGLSRSRSATSESPRTSTPPTTSPRPLSAPPATWPPRCSRGSPTRPRLTSGPSAACSSRRSPGANRSRASTCT